MMPKSGASLCTREKVGGAAISTSHLVKLGSALMRTWTRTPMLKTMPAHLSSAPDDLTNHLASGVLCLLQCIKSYPEHVTGHSMKYLAPAPT